MQVMIIGFIIGVTFTVPFSYVLHRMIMKAKLPEMCEKNCKLIVDAKNEIKEVREDRNNKLSSILNKVNEL